MDPLGNHIGFIAEEEGSIGNAMTRQLFRTHRAFTTTVFDKNQREVLRVCPSIYIKFPLNTQYG